MVRKGITSELIQQTEPGKQTEVKQQTEPEQPAEPVHQTEPGQLPEQRIWINGVAGETGLVPDEGVFFGRGVFETLHIGTTPWFLGAHLRRLHEGAARIGIEQRVDETTILTLIHRSAIRDCAMRITLTARNVIVNTRPLPYNDKETHSGLRVCMGTSRKNPHTRLASVKSTSYAENLLEREAATAKGFREALLLNTEGVLAEGSASNLFFVKDGRVCTPSVDCGLLPGIVRAWVLDNLAYLQTTEAAKPEISQRNAFSPLALPAPTLEEGRYPPDVLRSADEVFLTNSLMGIMGVRELEGYATWKIGPVTRWLQACYKNADKA